MISDKDLEIDQAKSKMVDPDSIHEKEIHEKGEGEGSGRWVCVPVETDYYWPDSHGFSKLDEALAYAEKEWDRFKRGEATDLFEDVPAWAGKASYLVGRLEPFVPSVDGSFVIDFLQEQAYMVGEVSEDWMDCVEDEEINSLTKVLTDAFNYWAREYHHTPNFSSVEDIREMLAGD